MCITEANHEVTLASHATPGTLLINLVTSISSHDVTAWAQVHDALDLDTCIDPWVGQDGELHTAANTNDHLCPRVLALARRQPAHAPHSPTAVVAHGASPVFVSILVKHGLTTLARRHLPGAAPPSAAIDRATPAFRRGFQVIQPSEEGTPHGTRRATLRVVGASNSS